VSRVVWYTIKPAARALLLASTRWQVEGSDVVPRHGPLVLVSNHISVADPVVLGASLPRRIIFMGKQELFRSIQGRILFRSLGVFPVRRGRHDRRALLRAREVLEQGHVLGMFPEGTRGPGGTQVRRGYTGAAFLALRSGVPLLPLGITGTERLRGVADLLRRPAITVRIGEPFSLPPLPGKRTSDQLAEATELIMERIACLLVENDRGVHAKVPTLSMAKPFPKGGAEG